MAKHPLKTAGCFALALGCCLLSASAQNGYQPTAQNLAARQAFQNMKFGLFIHWGPSSLLGAGEWVMNNRNIKTTDYAQLQQTFNPTLFDAKAWVTLAKKAGFKYITFITRHHDGFSNWHTAASPWSIANTPYQKDLLKQLADECHTQGITLFLYYSLLDWYRPDYPFETGRTGQGTGRSGKGNYAQYLAFMKAQLTELLTRYGPIGGIWFDGHWDQTAVEGAANRDSRINWRYDELYSLIHRLQPQCMVGNNHHLSPFEGEDFQMFERDLPGENKSGYNFQTTSTQLPLETCETINGSWGFNITDTQYKTVKQLVHYLVGAAGRNANFLLNIGPLPSGQIQTAFADTLLALGSWLQRYGPTIYNTRGSGMPAQPWGVVTSSGPTHYVHLLNANPNQPIFLPGFTKKITRAVLWGTSQTIAFKQQPEGVFLYANGLSLNEIDTVVQLDTER